LLELNILKKTFILFLILTFGLFFNSHILASESNIFGLHLTQTEDLSTAKDVINSNGGDWGWLTIVIRTDQLDYQTWQNFFDNCRRHHLIPIIRLATIAEGDNWKTPSISDIDNLANFLNSLNWPTQQQHLILFNEVNHGQEWGGEVDVQNYTDISLYTIKKFKELNPNFFILSTGLDLAAPSQAPLFESAKNYYQQIYNYKPEYFNQIDALASHSYPNHGFIGTPQDTGQHSIHGYLWELKLIEQLSDRKDLPVFITETGWPHQEGVSKRNNFYTTKTTSNFLLNSFDLWQQDPQVKAVTPFIYNYPNPPFDHFSWLDQQGQLYPNYQKIIDHPKKKNQPQQITDFEFYKNQLPFLIFKDTEYTAKISLKNTGQSIWGENNFCLKAVDNDLVELSPLCISPDDRIEPDQIKIFTFNFKIKGNLYSKQEINLAWKGLNPSIEITSFNKNATIYRSHFNLINKIKGFFQKFW
jgi:hypothetical protein